MEPSAQRLPRITDNQSAQWVRGVKPNGIKQKDSKAPASASNVNSPVITWVTTTPSNRASRINQEGVSGRISELRQSVLHQNQSASEPLKRERISENPQLSTQKKVLAKYQDDKKNGKSLNPEQIRQTGSSEIHYYIQEKKRGVEPGIEIKKKFQESDQKKLETDNSKLRNFTKNQIRAIVDGSYSPPIDASPEVKDKFSQLEKAIKGKSESSTGEILDSLVGNEDQKKLLIDHLEQSFPKFNKTHYVKLVYDDPIKGKVQIPIQNAKGNPLTKLIHQKGTADTPKSKNLGAIREKWANDLYKKFGIPGQKLEIHHTTYSDGVTQRLVLDSTECRGPQGEKCHSLGNKLINGYLPQNTVTTPDGKKHPVNEQDLARLLSAAYLLGDVDKLGSSGDNLLFYIDSTNGEARIVNIDPGKALPIADNEQRTSRINSFYLTGRTDRLADIGISTDFRIQQPIHTLADAIARGYKNFTVFYDTRLSAKVAGWQSIMSQWGEATEINNEYKEVFGEFEKEISKVSEKLEIRKNAIAEIMKKYDGLETSEIDLIENLEVFSSPVQYAHGPEDNQIYFKHLQVLPETRIEWGIKKNGDEVSLTSAGFPTLEMAASKMLNLQQLIGAKVNLTANMAVADKGGYSLILQCSTQDLKLLQEALTEERVRDAKGIGPIPQQ